MLRAYVGKRKRWNDDDVRKTIERVYMIDQCKSHLQMITCHTEN